MAGQTQLIRDQLAEVDELIKRAERRATRLRNQLARNRTDDLSTVSQLSDILDRLLQLKLTKDLLVDFLAPDCGFHRKRSFKTNFLETSSHRRRQVH